MLELPLFDNETTRFESPDWLWRHWKVIRLLASNVNQWSNWHRVCDWLWLSVIVCDWLWLTARSKFWNIRMFLNWRDYFANPHGAID
jgi:hypothetical protein